MYLELAVLMGIVWLRLTPTQGNIQAYTNAIFFDGTFMYFPWLFLDLLAAE
jgi:hypothetical protein